MKRRTRYIWHEEMITIEKKALPYLSFSGLLGGFSAYSCVKALNECCGFYHDEFKTKSAEEKISFHRLINAFAWSFFAALSGYGCYLTLENFTQIEKKDFPNLDLEKHLQQLNGFNSFYQARKSERSSLRQFCWSYLESSEALYYLARDASLDVAKKALEYTPQFLENLQAEQHELERLSQELIEDLNQDFERYQRPLQYYEIAKGLLFDFDALCQTPYGWLNTTTCLPHQHYEDLKSRYIQLQASINVYQQAVKSQENVQRCQEAFNPKNSLERVLEGGKILHELESESTFNWLKRTFSLL